MSRREEGADVLVTEDEALISLDLCETLEDAGFRVVGPAATLAEALSVLERDAPHLAVINMRLRDGLGDALVQALRRRHVPFVVYSGCLPDEPQAFGGVPWLVKPASPSAIVAALKSLCQRAHA